MVTRRRGRWLATAVAAVLTGSVGLGAPQASAATVEALGYDPVANKGALWNVAQVIGAHDAYRAGYTGKGIGIALIDTGVTEVPGLDTGNVFHGPDLSFDSQDPELAHKDAYGHGTHLASIIAGRDVVGTPASYTSQTTFNGIAPDANLISVKVGASDGAVDVTQVIAAVDWVVENRATHNIRVLNLSYGTNGRQDPLVDPLMYAVEQAWKAGIVVVVAGGNDGQETEILANPAQSPNLLAVGAADTQGTVTTLDDTVPWWASRGTDKRHVDLVAPGVSVLGTRVPKGYADERNEHARTGTRFARASGTSQSAAVVSGAAALLLQQQPRLTPAQVRAHLMATATSLEQSNQKHSGKGIIDLRKALGKKAGSAKDNAPFSNGTGTLEGARGTSHVFDGVSELTGELDIFGRPWDGTTWTQLSATQNAWVGGSWRGHTWAGDGWDGRSWRDVVWASGTWNARTWRGDEWTARTWRNGEWSARTWREGDWTARTWRDHAWTSASWDGDMTAGTWAAGTWAAGTWAAGTWG